MNLSLFFNNPESTCFPLEHWLSIFRQTLRGILILNLNFGTPNLYAWFSLRIIEGVTKEQATHETHISVALPNSKMNQQSPQKEYGLNWLTPFMGDWTKIENFIQECDMYLAINKAIYNNEPAKGAFVLSFMTDKEALKWKEQYIRSITNNNRITFLTYIASMAKF